jgi:hypothetical protein
MPHGMWRMRRTIYFEDKKIQNGTSWEPFVWVWKCSHYCVSPLRSSCW